MFSMEQINGMIAGRMEETDTFNFSCKACGDCCRKRSEPIMLTGYDIFRIATELKIEPIEVIKKYTRGYVGNNSKLPVVVLKERPDGSCSLLRNGKCMVHSNKPMVCAIYPLGRFYLTEEEKFGYFQQNITCGTDEQHTLKEWLDKFKIHDWDKASSLWVTVITKLAEQTSKQTDPKAIEALANKLAIPLYYDYNTESDETYEEQLAQNLIDMFEEK